MPRMLTDLFNQLGPQTVILTANKRASAFLLQEHSAYQQRLGLQVWLSADILPLSSWIARCWQECAETGLCEPWLLLSSSQEQALWEQIIEDSPQGEHLLKISPTAELAREAWGLLKQWRVSFHSLTQYANEDTAAFVYWAKQFHSFCQEHHWRDSHSLTDIVIEQIATGQYPLPKKIFLVGFDEITPQITELLTTLEQRGCQHQLIKIKIDNPQIQRLGLCDSEAELYAMAHWAKQLAQQSPDTSIGCVIPNLTAIRAQVERIFIEVFTPSTLLTSQLPHYLPFNISAGLPLAHYPLIHTALLCLELGRTDIALDDCSALLRSPFLGHANTEINERARLDVTLRSLNERFINIRHTLVSHSQKLPLWSKHLQAALKIFKSSEKLKATPSHWAHLVSQVLAALGWPGDRQFSSNEFQLVEHWHHLLQEFANLDHFIPAFTFTAAINHLQKLASATIYQPQSADVPVQIMGVLEASGLQFEHLWVMGLYDEVWPPAASANPFLPRQLQRRLQMPHGSAEQELHFAKTITQRLCESAKHIILSYPRQDQDRGLRPSPLIVDIPEIKSAALNLPTHTSYGALLLQTAQLEFCEDHQAPAIKEPETPKGGTAIFKHQAACPFRAFAVLRLDAKSIDTPKTGLSPSERGSLVHHALEEIWKTIRTHQQLCGSNEAELNNIIQQAIDIALTKMASKRPATLKQRFIQIEKQRLHNLLNTWLELEKQRSPFTVIATEHRADVAVAGIPLTIQVDRIDELADGRKIIIDYKTTAKPSIDNWLGERPDEPQLPLYCVANPEPISGILFAQLRADLVKFLGVTDIEDCIPEVAAITSQRHDALAETWEAQIHTWRQTLEQLAQEFQQGIANVNPKDLTDSCQFCDLTIFCRIHELA